METNSEKVFYQDADVKVTNTRFISQSKTYAMNNIASVSLHLIKRSIKGEIFLILLGIILLVSNETRIVGVVMIVAAIILLFVRKDSYSVRINSNSGEANGFISKDREVVQRIVTAVNDAMIYRG